MRQLVNEFCVYIRFCEEIVCYNAEGRLQHLGMGSESRDKVVFAGYLGTAYGGCLAPGRHDRNPLTRQAKDGLLRIWKR